MSANKKDKSGDTDKHDSSLVPVVIMGQTYKVRAEEDVGYIEELARFVDTKMRTIGDATGTAESLKVAILAALNIADELFKAEKHEKDSDEELADSVDELTKTLDKSLREPTQTSPAI
jgi:cell division protein ZapA